MAWFWDAVFEILEWSYKIGQNNLVWLNEKFGQILGWFLSFFAWLFSWIVAHVEPMFRAFAWGILEGVVALVGYYEPPAVFNQFNQNWSAIPWSEINFFLGPFEVVYGFTVIMSVVTVKFVMRWFPYFGAAFRSPS